MTNIRVYHLVGHHLALIIMIPDIILTRNAIEKMLAIVPAVIVILYHGLVWFLRYQLKWSWPLQTYFKNYFRAGIEPIYLFLAVAAWIGGVSFGVIFAYILVSYRE